MTETSPFGQFILHVLAPVGTVMLLGLLGGKGAKLIKLPKVTGYLLIGVIIGPSLLGLLSNEAVQGINLINDIALGLIMFNIGAVFEIHHIRQVGTKIAWITGAQALVSFVLTTLGLYFIGGLDFFTSALIGTISMEVAPAAILMVIREYNAKGEFTDTLLSVVAASTVVCILAFEFVYSLGNIGRDLGVVGGMVRPFYEFFGSLLVGGTVGYLISRWEEHIDDQAELLMIIIASIMLVVGISHTMQLQPLLATLIMGAITNNLSPMHRLVYVEMKQVEQPLYIAFFVLAGASLHLDLLPTLGLAGLVYLVLRASGKVIGTWVIAKVKNLGGSIRNNLGFAMMVHAGVAIGLVDTLSRNSPELAKIVSPIVLVSVLIYETAGPPLIRLILLKVGDATADEAD